MSASTLAVPSTSLDDVKSSFRLFLGRDATDEEAAPKIGLAPSDLATEFIQSAEFAYKFGFGVEAGSDLNDMRADPFEPNYGEWAAGFFIHSEKPHRAAATALHWRALLGAVLQDSDIDQKLRQTRLEWSLDAVLTGLIPPPSRTEIEMAKFDSVELSLAGKRLGLVWRLAARLTNGSPTERVSAAVRAAVEFVALSRLAPGELTLTSDNESFALPPAAPDRMSVVLGCWDGRVGPKLADVWLGTGHTLKLRLNTPAPIDYRLCLSAYQRRLGNGVPLVQLANLEPVDSATQSVTLALDNVYQPVLLTLTDDAGVLEAMDVLPFPSLCRNGAHHAELRAAAMLGNELDDLREYSRSLGQASLRAPGRLFSIAVSCDGATGNEQIFDADFRRWATVSHKAGVSLSVPRRGDRDVLASLSSGLSLPEADPAQTVDMVLPADAIPTIDALVRPRAATAEPLAPASYAVSIASDMRMWVVSQPAVPALAIAQSAPGDSSWGVMVARPPTAHHVGPPSAIRQIASIDEASAASVFPVAPARAGDGAQGAPVSVCIAISPSDPDPTILIEAIAQQEHGAVEIVVVSAGEPADELTARLQKFAPDRHQLIVVNSGARTDWMNAAAAAARHPVMVFAEPQVILHDRRALGVLARLADVEGVGSASIALIRPAGRKLSVACAGYFLSGLSLSTPPALTFSAFDSREALPRSTYAVAANARGLLAIGRTAFDRLGGFAGDGAPWDIDFGLRAIDAGLINLCCNSITAFVSGAWPSTQYDTNLARRLGNSSLARLADSMTLLRRVL